MDQLFTLKDVTTLLKVKPHKVTYLLTTKKIEEPIHIGNRRMFTKADIIGLAKELNVEIQLPADGEVV